MRRPKAKGCGFCAVLVWKRVLGFAHFGLESGIVFEGTTGVYERIYRFNYKWIRTNRNLRIRKAFEEFFYLRSKLSNNDIISAKRL